MKWYQSDVLLGTVHYKKCINSLPRDTFFDWTKFKTCADEKFKVTKMTISVFDRVESIVEKGENAGDLHFLLFPPSFHKAFYKKGLCG